MFADDDDIFGAIAQSGARVLVIGRRAMAVLGVPVLTADYDIWAHADDLEPLNAAFEDLDFAATVPPAEARKRGRYVLEDGEHIDVLVARSQSTRDGGARLTFDEAWGRRLEIRYDDPIKIYIPCISDLILTKRWGMRDKDIADIHLLETLQRNGGETP